MLLLKRNLGLFPNISYNYYIFFRICVPGKLRSAAEKIEDEEILKDIRGKDCSCIEVRYHKSCHNNYVRVLKNSDLLGKKYVDLLFCISECSYDVPFGFNFFKDCLK